MRDDDQAWLARSVLDTYTARTCGMMIMHGWLNDLPNTYIASRYQLIDFRANFLTFVWFYKNFHVLPHSEIRKLQEIKDFH